MSRLRELPGIDPALDAPRALAAGILAAFGYLGCMYVDMAVTRSRSDDLFMLGRPLTASPVWARALGLTAHVSFGGVVGFVYAAYGRKRLSGPDWLRGVKALAVENTGLWPLTFIVDRVHPAMRNGELPRLNTPIPFVQQWARHMVFGYILGAVYGGNVPESGG